MKKKNNKMVKLSAILATALIAASATGISTSAQSVRTMEAERVASQGTAASNVKASLSLKGASATPGETVSVPMIINSENTCTCYDVVIEYDARLTALKPQGVKAYCDFEENGRKFMSLVGFEAEPYEDGSAVATLNFQIPEGAENDNYNIRFSQITNFSTEEADYENYTTDNTYINVTGGVEKVNKGNSITLSHNQAIAGENCVVQVIPTSGNKATCYDMVVEYDPRLFLETRDVRGANASDIFEEDGKCYVSLVGYTSDIYTDGSPMAALNFHVPADAAVGERFEVKIAKITTFSTEFDDITDYTYSDGSVEVMAEATPAGTKGSFKTYYQYAEDGTLIGSKVGIRGDFTGNGNFDIRDCAAIAKICASAHGNSGNENSEAAFFGDINDDNVLNIRDSAQGAKHLANLTETESWS